MTEPSVEPPPSGAAKPTGIEEQASADYYPGDERNRPVAAPKPFEDENR